MKRGSIFILLLVLFISQSWAIPLPIELPQSSLGLEEVTYGDPVTIKFTAIYDLRGIKQVLNDPFRLYIPVPSSTQYQNVVISEVLGLEIEDIQRDVWGNTVLKTAEKGSGEYPDSVTVTAIVETAPRSFTLPKGYYYDLEIHENLKVEKELRFQSVIEVVKEYRTALSSNSDPLKRIYNKRIDALYPFSREDYLKSAREFSSKYAAQGIKTRYHHGWYFPHKVDRFFRNFRLEIAASEGFLYFDEKLELYKSPGSEVGMIFSPQEGDEEPFYLGIEKEGIMLFPKIGLYITGGEVGSTWSDPRYDNQYDTLQTAGYENRQVEDFIIPGSSINSTEGFVLSRKKSANRMYYENAAPIYVEELVMCEKIENYQPVGITSTFTGLGKATAFITFKDQVSEKKMTCTWIMPSGTKYYDFTTDVNRTWGIYYLYLNIIQGMEKGVWTLKIEINGNLEGRVNFTIR